MIRKNTFGLAAMACVLPACFGQATSYSISTVVGNTTSGAGYSGDGAAATNAKLNLPIEIGLDAQHNLYIADSGNNRIRKVTASTGKISTIAGTTLSGYAGDGGPAANAQFWEPYGIWLDSSGNIFIADLNNHVVRKINTSGVINTVAGNNSANFSGDGGLAIDATLDRPLGVVTDAAGDLYIADSFNHRVRIVTPDGNINTYAGSGVANYSGDGGPAVSADINRPYGLAVDAAGNLYIADSHNNRIRMVTPRGIITTVVGTGTAGFSGDGGLATKAEINQPWDVKVDSAGDLFIADELNNRVRMVTPNGIITTIAGGSGPGYTGDGGPATSADLNEPTGLAIDTNGNIYIADSANDVIRMLTPSAPAVGAGGVVSASAFGGFTAVAPGSWIEIYGSNLSTDQRSWGTADFQGNNAPTQLDGTSVTIGGQAAYVYFISGGQVDVQVPSNLQAGSQALVVKTPAGSSAGYNVTVNATEPGLLAPASFNIGGTQYVVAQFTDGVTYVLPPGAISSVTSRRANPGDIIVIYGIGFGSVTPNIPAGQIVQQSNQLVVAPQVLFGSTPATVQFAGLAPGYVGLYQFNVVVPNISASDKVPVTFTLGGVPGTQTLFTAVQ